MITELCDVSGCSPSGGKHEGVDRAIVPGKRSGRYTQEDSLVVGTLPDPRVKEGSEWLSITKPKTGHCCIWKKDRTQRAVRWWARAIASATVLGDEEKLTPRSRAVQCSCACECSPLWP